MTNNILFIALVVLAVTEVIFAVGFIMMLSKIKKLDSDCIIFKAIMETDRDITNELAKTVSEEAETYEHIYELCDLMADQNNKIVEQYQNILKQYEIFHESYQMINENYKKLLNCWKDVTSVSDNASEQFRLCALELKRYADILAPWVIDSDQLGHEYAEKNEKAHSGRYEWDDERPCKSCTYGVFSVGENIWLCSNSPNREPYDFPCPHFNKID